MDFGFGRTIWMALCRFTHTYAATGGLCMHAYILKWLGPKPKNLFKYLQKICSIQLNASMNTVWLRVARARYFVSSMQTVLIQYRLGITNIRILYVYIAQMKKMRWCGSCQGMQESIHCASRRILAWAAPRQQASACDFTIYILNFLCVSNMNIPDYMRLCGIIINAKSRNYWTFPTL